MMIGVGFMVGIIIISMYLPMFKLMQLIGNQQLVRRAARETA